jgi:hypothetical protein
MSAVAGGLRQPAVGLAAAALASRVESRHSPNVCNGWKADIGPNNRNDGWSGEFELIQPVRRCSVRLRGNLNA